MPLAGRGAALRALELETRAGRLQALGSGWAWRVRPELGGSAVRVAVRPSQWGGRLSLEPGRGLGASLLLRGALPSTCHLLEVLRGGLRGSGVRMGTPARRRRTVE